MKSRTSFFNFTVLRKDLTRFSPLWGLMLIFTLLGYLTGILIDPPDLLASDIAYEIPGHSITQFFFGGLCALLVFGDLFKPRAAGMLHALPLRREGWFFTHTVSAILIYLLAMAIPQLLKILLLQKFWYLALLSLAVQLGMFLFYFGVAAFAIQCAGSWLGAAAVYCLVNFLTALLTFLGQTFFQPQLYGIIFKSPVLQLLCPAAEVTSREFVNVVCTYNGSGYRQTFTATFHGIVPGDWWYLLAVVAAGVVFWVLALLLYRRRHIEKAGNFIALRFVAVSFLFALTLLAGAVCFRISISYILLLIGLGIGFFPGLMLLERQLKVFRKRSLLAFGILALALFATIGIVRADPLGMANYVPATDEVESVVVSTDTYLNASVLQKEQVTLDTTEELQQLEALHKALIEEKKEKTSSLRPYATQELKLTYKLKSGRTVVRAYPYPDKGGLQRQVNELLSRLDVFETTDPLREIVCIKYDHDNDTQAYPDVEIRAEGLISGTFDPKSDVKISASTTLDENPEAIAMWEALQKDCLEGVMSQHWDYQASLSGTLRITFRNEDGTTQTLVLKIFTACDNFRHFLLTLKDAQ